ncbi:MAG TPA: hypothetical protein PLZ57_11445 [Pseudobdellovibrionaceae bacterium]|nr:hypothetical protein [Pseudobdellovibrionaceae bacterium]
MKQLASLRKSRDLSWHRLNGRVRRALLGLLIGLMSVVSSNVSAQASNKAATPTSKTRAAAPSVAKAKPTNAATKVRPVAKKPKIKRTYISFDDSSSTKAPTGQAARPRPQPKTLKAPRLMFASGAVAPTSLYLPDTDEMSVTRQREDKLRAQQAKVKREIVLDEEAGLTTSTAKMSARTYGVSEEKQRFKLRPSLNYSVRSDLADERDPRVSTHRLGAMMSATIFNRAITPGFDEEMADELVTLTASIAGQARTIGQELDGQQGGFDLADLDVAASRSFDLGDWATASHSLDAALGTNIPTSVDSQYEGVKAVPYASLGVASSFRGGRVQLLNSVTGDYVVNTYTYSPSSRQINPDASVGYTLGGSILIASGFRFGASATARLTHHLDDSVSNGFSNQQTLSWSNKTWTVSLRHSNGSRPEDRESNLWFFDQVRRMVALSVTARF